MFQSFIISSNIYVALFSFYSVSGTIIILNYLTLSYMSKSSVYCFVFKSFVALMPYILIRMYVLSGGWSLLIVFCFCYGDESTFPLSVCSFSKLL